MEKKYPLLCAIALRLLSMHATSCGSERNWSVWRFTCRDNRRRLALQKVCCLPLPHSALQEQNMMRLSVPCNLVRRCSFLNGQA